MGWSPATSLRMVKRYGHIGASAQREALAKLDDESAVAEQPPAPQAGQKEMVH